MSTAHKLWQRVTVLAFITMTLMTGGQSIAAERKAKANDNRILKALDEDVEFELVETPLDEFAGLVATQFDIPVLLDVRSLDEEGIDTSEPITISIKGIPLQAALDLILDRLQIEWVRHQGVLLFTTMNETQDSFMETRVYPVDDLLRPNRDVDGEAAKRSKYDALYKVLTSSVGSEEDWEETGGPGRIESFDGMIVVKQTPRLQRELALLLESLRDARLTTALANADAAKTAGNEPQTVTYPIMTPTEQLVRRSPDFGFGSWVLPGSDEPDPGARPSDQEAQAFSERLADAIISLVAPDTWNADAGVGTIQAVPGALIIRQLPAVHAEIRQVLRSFMPPSHDAVMPGAFDLGDQRNVGGGETGGVGVPSQNQKGGGFF